jgi:hypothetical protein
MSIEELGKGLVKEGRARRDKMRRRQERYDRKVAMASIAVPLAGGIIKDNLQQKAQDFFNSEEVMNLKRQHDKAIRGTSTVFAQRDAISASPLNDYDYFYAQYKPIVEAGIDDETTAQQEGLHSQTGEKINPVWRDLVATETKKLAEARTQEYRTALSAAEKVVSSEQFDSMLVNKIKDTTPQNIVDAVGRRVSTLFGGSSTEERQRMALNSVRNHYFSTDAASFTTFNDKYEQTGNIREAINFAELTKDMADYEPELVFEDIKSTHIKDRDGNLVRVEETRNFDSLGRQRESTYVYDTEIPGLDQGGLSDAQEESLLRSLTQRFSITKNPQDVLSDRGMRAWIESIDIKKGDTDNTLLPNLVENVDEYWALVNHFNNFQEENKDNSSYMKPTPEARLYSQHAIEAYQSSDVFAQSLMNLDKSNYYVFQAERPEEYRIAKNYFIEEKLASLMPGERRTQVPKPEYFDEMLPALQAEIQHFGTLEMIQSYESVGLEIIREQPTVSPDASVDSSEVQKTTFIPGGPNDPAVLATSRGEISDEAEEPASLIALREELEALPEPFNRELNILSPPVRQKEENLRERKSELEDKINNWEEYQVDLIERLEEKVTAAEEGSIAGLYFGTEVPGPNTIPNYKKHIQSLKDELEQFRKFNQSETDTNNFVEPTPSLLVSADPK